MTERGEARMSFSVPCATISPPCTPAPGPISSDVIRHADRVFVVLDHDDRIAEIAQSGQRAEQSLVVALVQADRRLVEHVHHADEAGADLRGEADALRLAAGERIGLAVEREVVEADVDQEAAAAREFP